MSQVPTTTNYSLFQLLDFNRNVNKTKRLEASMKKHGYINAYPLHVVRRDGKLKIKAGHHRFSVASKLGLPVAYVVCNDSALVHELEAATVKWDMNDYLTSFVRLGDPDYIEVYKYHKRTGVGVGMIVSMFSGEMAASGNYGEAFKSGEFVIKDRLHAESVAELLETLKKSGISWAADRLVVCSLSRIISAGHADLLRLKNKIKGHACLIAKQPDMNAYMGMWEKIYNRSAHNDKIPLTFLTNETIEKRALENITKLIKK